MEPEEVGCGVGEVSRGHRLLSWLLAKFMALCISASIRCFSLLGMRPKRTAATGREPCQEVLTYSHASFPSFLPKGQDPKSLGFHIKT